MIPILAVSAALAELPVFHEDRANPYKGAQLAVIAKAVAKVAKNREEAALLITLGHHESGLSFRIHAGLCRAFECDRGRAAGLWQAHQNSRSLEEWHGFVGLDRDATTRAAQAAVIDIRRAAGYCRGEPDLVLATIRAYAGRGCRGALKGERDRVATYYAVRARL